MTVHKQSELRKLQSLWKYFNDTVWSEMSTDRCVSFEDIFIETMRRLDGHMAQFLDSTELDVYQKVKILLARYKAPLVTTVGIDPSSPPQQSFTPSCYQDVFGVLEPEIQALLNNDQAADAKPSADDTDDNGGVFDPTSSEQPSEAGHDFDVDESARTVRCAGTRLNINGSADFMLLMTLIDSFESIVPYGKLLCAIKPDECLEGPIPRYNVAPTEVKDAKKHVSVALRNANLPYEIFSKKKVGYELRSVPQ